MGAAIDQLIVPRRVRNQLLADVTAQLRAMGRPRKLAKSDAKVVVETYIAKLAEHAGAQTITIRDDA
jgi:hypothetical protein